MKFANIIWLSVISYFNVTVDWRCWEQAAVLGNRGYGQCGYFLKRIMLCTENSYPHFFLHRSQELQDMLQTYTAE